MTEKEMIQRNIEEFSRLQDYMIEVFADMAELADALDLGSSGRPCRFKSCYPHFYSIE